MIAHRPPPTSPSSRATMTPKQIAAAVLVVVLAGLWVVLTVRGITPPAALAQAIVAAVGAVIATATPGQSQ